MDRYKELSGLVQLPALVKADTKVCVCVCGVCACVWGVGYHFILLNFVKSELAKMVRRSDFHCSFSLLVLTVIRFLSPD